MPFRVSLFLILAIVTTLLCGLVFGVSQQIYRQGANDPQIQLAEDMARYIGSGNDVHKVMPGMDVDIASSLVWFLVIYDGSGQVVAANGKLDGQVPVLPQGVLENAKKMGQNRVTWEPKEGVRIATVVVPYEGGYVLAGRNLRETEGRIMMLAQKVFVGWVVMVGVVFLGSWFLISKKTH